MPVAFPRITAAGVILAVALTGCGPQPAAPLQPSPTTSSIAPVVQQQRETGLVRPATVFDGDCDAMFTPAELEAIVGEPMSLGDNHFRELWGGTGLIDQSGGLLCTWWGNESRVIALVLPDEAVSVEPRSNDVCSTMHDLLILSCPVDRVANRMRLSALVSRSGDEAAIRAAGQSLGDAFATGAEAAAAVPVPLPAIGSWQLTPSCQTVIESADLSAVSGLGSGATSLDILGAGYDSPSALLALAGEWAPLTCMIQGESAQVEFVPVGGARWREQDVAARTDATVLQLGGIEAAYAVPAGEELTLVYAFDGPNMLMFSVRFTKNAAGIAAALIASLDATAVS